MSFNDLTDSKLYYKDETTGEICEVGVAKYLDVEYDGCLSATIGVDFSSDFGRPVIVSRETENAGWVYHKKVTFKPGDIVRIRKWDDMAREFGVSDDTINCKHGFVSGMKGLCDERCLVIKDITDDDEVIFENVNFGWTISTDMIEHESIIAQADCEKTLSFEFTKDGMNVFERYVLGEWDIEEKEEGKDMKLVKIYEERALKVIEDAKKKEVKERIENHPIIRKFNDLVNLFEKATDELYHSQGLCDVFALTDKCGSNMFKYGVGASFYDLVENEVSDKYEAMKNELSHKLSEVNAQIELLEQMDPEDRVMAIQEMLIQYGVLNEDGTIATYEINTTNPYVETKEEAPATEPKKRGRKASKNKKGE